MFTFTKAVEIISQACCMHLANHPQATVVFKYRLDDHLKTVKAVTLSNRLNGIHDFQMEMGTVLPEIIEEFKINSSETYLVVQSIYPCDDTTEVVIAPMDIHEAMNGIKIWEEMFG